MAMGNRQTNPTNIADGLMVNEVWSKLIQRNLDDYGVMADCVNRKYEGEIKFSGDTVRIPTLGNITVRTHSDATAITYDTPSGSEQTLLIDQQKEWGFKISKIEMKQANIKELQSRYVERAKVALANNTDTALHALGFAGVDSNNQIGTVAVTKANIYDVCLDLYQALADSNAINASGKGDDGKRPWLVVPPAIVKLMKASDEMTHSTAAADEVIRKGTILQYAGFDVKQSTLVKGTAGSGTTSFNILAGTTEAITYARQIIDTEVFKDKDYHGIFVSGLDVYGHKVIQPKALASATLTV